MAENSPKELGAGESSAAEKKDTSTVTTKKRKGFLSRVWNGVFRSGGDDFEKRLQFISKEEASVLARMKRRAINSRKLTRNLIIFSVFFEVIAVGYAIMTTRSLDLNWKMRAFRVLPMFILPALSTAAYSGLISFMKMCDRNDKKTLERLRGERQEKIDELKERTNYYITQQLIQRYDPDPAAKAAAATVLASKLGADSGLKVYVGDDTGIQAPSGKSNDVEYVQSSGLRNRKQPARSASTGSTLLQHSDAEMTLDAGMAGSGASEHNEQVVVDHHHYEGAATHDGGWISRIAALLVGEDPTQSYALICGNCHMHNGLARKEEFPYITYFCPHCHALNKSKQLEEHVSSSNSPNTSSLRTVGSGDMVTREIVSVSDAVSTRNNPVSPVSEIEEVSEVVVPAVPVN